MITGSTPQKFHLWFHPFFVRRLRAGHPGCTLGRSERVERTEWVLKVLRAERPGRGASASSSSLWPRGRSVLGTARWRIENNG